MHLSQYLDVSWLTARSMLRKIRVAMGKRDSLYRLTHLVEVDDALLGGKRFREALDEEEREKPPS